MILKIKDGQQVGRYSSVAEAAAELNIPATNIYAVLRGNAGRTTAGGFEWREVQDPVVPGDEGTHVAWDEHGDGATFSGIIINAPGITHDEILAKYQVDLEKWEYVKHTIKEWSTTLKKKVLVDPETGKEWQKGVPFKKQPVSTHEIHKVHNTGFTIELRLRTDFRNKLVEQLMEHVGVLPRKATPRTKGQYVAELMITDHHLGKAGFDPETLKLNWSLDEALDVYQAIIDDALFKLPVDRIEYFVLPTGNDLLHVDSNLGTTTKGTKLLGEVFWLNLFRYGKEAVILAIDRLLDHAPVKVPFIPGNHDFNGVLALSEVIKEAYKNNPHVETLCSGRGREWIKYGHNLMGWHHGNGCTPQKAQAAMIADVPAWVGETTHRTVHAGHRHIGERTEYIVFTSLEEVPGLIYEICPTVTPVDQWHDAHLFVGNIRRSKTFLYNKLGGVEQEIVYNKR